ncbi:MAG: beta-galactosidase [Verrucomicrobiae bacterium]|nr:beta-galactosidase [Verrucomicrobiae bacterium]
MRCEFLILDNDFFLNGKPCWIIIGAMRYFRVLPSCWMDRLLKMKACELNIAGNQ